MSESVRKCVKMCASSDVSNLYMYLLYICIMCWAFEAPRTKLWREVQIASFSPFHHAHIEFWNKHFTVCDGFGGENSSPTVSLLNVYIRLPCNKTSKMKSGIMWWLNIIWVFSSSSSSLLLPELLFHYVVCATGYYFKYVSKWWIGIR